MVSIIIIISIRSKSKHRAGCGLNQVSIQHHQPQVILTVGSNNVTIEALSLQILFLGFT